LNKKKVSLILPTYNRSEFLPTAIESCISQSYAELELIIVDDGSTDSTREVIKEYLYDERISYYWKPNGGLPAALNFGLDRVTGDYITWTSDDNFFKENAIEKLVNVLNEVATPAFVYSNMSYINEAGNEISFMDSNCQNRIYMHNYIGASFLYDYKVFKEVGYYDQTLKLVEDYDYWIRIYENFPMIHLNENLYSYRIHKNSLSSTKAIEVQNMFNQLYEKNQVYFKLLADIQENCDLKNKEIYIWGTSSFAKRIYENLNIDISGFIEGINQDIKSFLNKPVISPDKIENKQHELFIIIASTYRAEIERILHSYGWNVNQNYY